MKSVTLVQEAPACQGNPLVPTVVRVRKKRQETHDVVSLWLEAPEPLRSAWLPGQFNMLYAFGVGEAAISIAGGSPRGSGTVMHTLRIVGTVTQALAALRVGDTLGLRGPFGRPWPLAATRGRDVLLLGGGIGLAPLRSVIKALTTPQALRDPQRGRLWVLHGARTPDDLLYRQELAQWVEGSRTLPSSIPGSLSKQEPRRPAEGEKPRVEALITVDQAPAAWDGSVGVITRLLEPLSKLVDGARTLALLCGPEIMMRFAVRSLLQLGLDKEHIYVSLERGMACATGFCGHCQLGPYFVCRDGPVFDYTSIEPWLGIREV